MIRARARLAVYFVFLPFCCVYVSEREFHLQECLPFLCIFFVCCGVRCPAAGTALLYVRAARCALFLLTIQPIIFCGRRPFRSSGKRLLFSMSRAGAGAVPSVGRSVGLVLSAMAPPEATCILLHICSPPALAVKNSGTKYCTAGSVGGRTIIFIFSYFHTPQPSN